VTKEGRDVSGLGAREGLVVRDVLHVHALQVRTVENGNKKKQRVDLILGVPILISLGAKLTALKTFYGWVARVLADYDLSVHTLTYPLFREPLECICVDSSLSTCLFSPHARSMHLCR